MLFDDAVWILNKLPVQIVSYIVADYCPIALFLLGDEGLDGLNWGQQLRITFGAVAEEFSARYMYGVYCQRYDLKYNLPAIQILKTDSEYLFLKDGVLSYCLYDNSVDAAVTALVEVPHVPKNVRQIAWYGNNLVILCGCGKLMYCETISRNCNKSTILTVKEDGALVPKWNLFGVNDVVQIATGFNYMIILRADGVLMGCGYNTFGNLGLGHEQFCEGFVIIKGVPSDIVQIACGNDSSVILCEDGTLMSCGYNAYGQLGLGDCYRRNKFEKVVVPNDIVQVVCAFNHTVVLRANGSLMSCGSNESGQLGRYIDGMGYTFGNVCEVPKDVVQVACNKWSTTVLRADGGVMLAGGQRLSSYFGFKKLAVHAVLMIFESDTFSFVLKNDLKVMFRGGSRVLVKL